MSQGLAHIFTGLGSDFNQIKQVVKFGRRKDKAIKHPDDVPRSPAFSSSSPSSACVQQQRLREAEDDRWLQVEGGSPLRWRSCASCAFLSPVDEPACEVCGTLAPVLGSDERNIGSDDLANCAARSSTGKEAYQHEQRRASLVSLQEVIIAEDAPLSEDRSEIPRRNVVIVAFKALDKRRQGRLAPADMQRFSQLMGFSDGWDEHTWAQEYVSIADEYGWDAMEGATLRNFVTCVDDADGDWYCSTGALWACLARLDRQEELKGARSHTSAALRSGSAALEVDLQPFAQGLIPGPPLLEDGEEKPSDAHEATTHAASEGNDESSSSSSDDEEYCESEGEVIPGTLDESPPEGTQVKVLYDNDVWYSAKVATADGCVVEVVYESGDREQLDLGAHAVRLADYCSEDSASEAESDDWEDDDEHDSDEEHKAEINGVDETEARGADLSQEGEYSDDPFRDWEEDSEDEDEEQSDDDAQSDDRNNAIENADNIGARLSERKTMVPHMAEDVSSMVHTEFSFPLQIRHPCRIRSRSCPPKLFSPPECAA